MHPMLVSRITCGPDGVAWRAIAVQTTVLGWFVKRLTLMPGPAAPGRQRRLRPGDHAAASPGTRGSVEICPLSGADWEALGLCPEVGQAVSSTAWPRSRAPHPVASGCLAGNARCDQDADCCSGVCTMHRRCGCFDFGHLCPSDGYCCSGVCHEHRCQPAAVSLDWLPQTRGGDA